MRVRLCKTSLVRRFVEGIYHEEYVPTIGVNSQKKEGVLDDSEMTLLLWNLNGEGHFQSGSGRCYWAVTNGLTS